MKELKILILDDKKDYREGIEEYLSTQGFTVFKAARPSIGLKILEKEPCDIVVLDIKLPEMNGIQFLRKIKLLYPDIEVIMITGHGDMDSVIESLRNGASDFFTKPFRLFDLRTAIERTKKYVYLQEKISNLEFQYEHLISKMHEYNGERIIGESHGIKEIIDLMEKVAKTDDTTVLITGDCGTGKELVARGIHALSTRRDALFFDVNCGSIADNLFESEFFGHQKGSFTGAYKSKAGFLEVAKKGTIFLDEICDMPKHMQTKLLRVLEGKTFRRVGSNKDLEFDARVISATNRDIDEAVERKDFREDLFFRLNTFHIHIPPLKERKEDIPLLIDHFVKFYIKKHGKNNIKKVSPLVYDYLMEYEFTGNVRELQHMIEKAIIICGESVLKVNYFKAMKSDDDLLANGILALDILHEKEKKMIIQALDRTKNNKSKAAELLNISRSALNRKISKHNIE